TDQNNYMLGTTPTTSSADISKRPLNVTATANSANKQYDGNTSATGQTVTTDRIVISGTPDDVTVSFTALVAEQDAGTGKLVSLNAFAITGGADQNNYMLAATPTNTTADIAPKLITVNVTVSDKAYDAGVTASVTGCSPNGIISGDTVTCSAATANFLDKNVGNNKAVTAGGLTLAGNVPDKNNYSI